MDEFGSPLAGGIQAVRRNISSSFFGAPRQRQADPVTTSLLQQQSLSITSVSQQLQNISSQIGTLDLNLKGVKENLALNDQLERQREAAKQNRERILAEQGLREGKESALENKIQQSLTQPLQRIGQKTQNTLGSLTKFLFTLAGGWLTITGIDLLQSMAEGNVDKINRLKTRFIGGLTIIAGSLTAITLGIKNTIGLIGNFTGLVARTAFSGLLKVGLKGVQVLLAGLVKKAAMLGGGFLAGGGIGAIIREIGGLFLYNRIAKFIGNIFRKKTKIPVPSNIGNISRTFFNQPQLPPAVGVNAPKITSETIKKPGILNRVVNPIRKKLFPTAADVVASGGVFKKGSQASMLSPMKVARESGLNPLKNFIGNLFKKLPGKNVLAKLLSSVGVKGGLKTLFKKFGGPLATFIINLASGDGIGKALAATAGYAAAAAATAKILAPMLALPIPGARILYGILVLAGGLAGEAAIRKLYDGILGLFGFGKNKDKDKNKKKDKDGKPIVNQSNDGVALEGKTYSQEEVDMLNAGGTLDAAGNVVPINNGNQKATEISELNDEPEIITLPMPGASGVAQNGGGGGPVEKASNSLPSISFDDNNPHTLYATAVTGAGN